MKNLVLVAIAAALLLSTTAGGQLISGTKIRDLPHDTLPADTDRLPVAKDAGLTYYQTRADLRSGLINANTTYSAACVLAAPALSTGVLSCRALTSTDIPALAYVSSTATQSANTIFAGPTTGSASAPGFRALVLADLPTIATAKLLGSVSGSTAAPGAVTVGSGLSLSAGTLSATGGAGTVTSVSGPAELSWANSTTTPTATWVSQTAAKVFASPSGSTGTPSFRALVASDIPSISAATQLTNTLQAAQFPALTGDITTSAGSLATTLKTSPTITTPIINKPTIGIVGTAGSAHIKGVGTSPTVSCTGLGTGGTAAVSGPDLAPVVTMTAGSSASSSGTCTLTMNSTFTNNATCVAMLANGTGTWQVTSVVILSTSSATAPQFTWADNNSGAPSSLTSGQTYLINIICIER